MGVDGNSNMESIIRKDDMNKGLELVINKTSGERMVFPFVESTDLIKYRTAYRNVTRSSALRLINLDWNCLKNTKDSCIGCIDSRFISVRVTFDTLEEKYL